jgi:hypothetical protein
LEPVSQTKMWRSRSKGRRDRTSVPRKQDTLCARNGEHFRIVTQTKKSIFSAASNESETLEKVFLSLI